MKITIKQKREVRAITTLAEGLVKTEPNLSGCSVEVEVGDFTSVDGLDELDGAMVLSAVVAELDRLDDLERAVRYCAKQAEEYRAQRCGHLAEIAEHRHGELLAEWSEALGGET